MPVTTHKYTNGEMTVVWKPGLCIHSSLCWKNLGEVFNPRVKPWINMNGAATEQIINQVRKCPSGALSYFMNEQSNSGSEDAAEKVISEQASIVNIEVRKNGPLVIRSGCTITFADGKQEVKNGVTSLCRCGASSNKPYCDSTHLKIGFTG